MKKLKKGVCVPFVALLFLFLVACGGGAAVPVETEVETVQEASGYPVTIDNCGLEIVYDAPPERAVTMNQAATEIMLALGLEESMIGTAYLDDAVLPEMETAYNAVPVLSEAYPSQEVLFGSETDFVYGVYRSAFGDEAAGPREELLPLEIGSYLSGVACEDEALRPDKATFDIVYGEIMDIGRIFGVDDRAEALVAEMQAELDAAQATVAELDAVSILWYDSGSDLPFVGACCGTPNMIIEAVGGENIFADAEGNWAEVSWEEVLERNPNAIVIVDASWDPAQDKIDLLTSDPLYSTMTAVQNEAFITIPFSATTLGVRNANAVVDIAAGLAAE
ncbi:MAG: ABC transporter substrate-binding protein [Chloroflexota bacterium]